MNVEAKQLAAEARIKLLEEALAEYALRYGLTERARALLVGPGAAQPSGGLPSEQPETR